MSTNELTIIVAEDDEDDRLLLEEAFEEVGNTASLTFAHDGVHLIELLERGHFPRQPLVLLDLNMPRMSGREVLRAVRAHPLLKTTPIVVLSTSTASEDINEAYALGANTFFSKPPSFTDLVGTVRSLYEYWSGRVALPGPMTG